MTKLSFTGIAAPPRLEVDLDSVFNSAEAQGLEVVEGALNVLLARLAELGIRPTDRGKSNLLAELQKALRMNRMPSNIVIAAEAGGQQIRTASVGDVVAMEGFDFAQRFPDADAARRYQSLIGLDTHKERLLDAVREYVEPERLRQWKERHHAHANLPALDRLQDRTALVLLLGDVGTGKTELAESFPEALARATKRRVTLLRLSLANRGEGLQGQSTQRIGLAFKSVMKAAAEAPEDLFIVLVDEADAIAQSRSESQMHHEDRAAVNALIQSVDRLRTLKGRVLVLFCSNRGEAIDAALVRRAGLVLHFARPDAAARAELLSHLFGAVLSAEQLAPFVDSTGEADGRTYGYTSSDIVNRLVPEALRAAIRANRPLSVEDLHRAIAMTHPTPPFGHEGTR